MNRDYVSGDIESQVITALKELTASNVLRITEDCSYLMVYRTIPTIALGDESSVSQGSTKNSRKRQAPDTSVVYVNEHKNPTPDRIVKAGRRKTALKKTPRG